jgi:hypothetical protein
VNEASALGTGHLPKYADDMYYVGEDRLYLIPTAEVPVTNIHSGELLDAGRAAERYVAYTPCFRREAGSHGKDTRGILRVHQFDKVELMRFERPEASRAALDELTAHAEAVLQRLGCATACCCWRAATSASRMRRRTTSRCGRRAWSAGSRCRAAPCTTTTRRGAQTSGSAPPRARSRSSRTRSTARGWACRARSSPCSRRISRRTAASAAGALADYLGARHIPA